MDRDGPDLRQLRGIGSWFERNLGHSMMLEDDETAISTGKNRTPLAEQSMSTLRLRLCEIASPRGFEKEFLRGIKLWSKGRLVEAIVRERVKIGANPDEAHI